MLLKYKRSIALIVILSLLFSMNAFAAENQPDNSLEQELDANAAAMIDELFGVSVADGTQKYYLSSEKNQSTRNLVAQGETVIIKNGCISYIGSFNKAPNAEICNCSPEESYENCLESLPALMELFQIEGDYELSDGIIVSDDLIMFTASKRMENGIYNDLQSLKICYDMHYGKYALVNLFDYVPNALTPMITQEEAAEIAYGCVTENNAIKHCELTYVDPSIYNSKVYSENTSVLAYVVTFENCDIIIIDAVSGSIIGYDLFLSEQAQCYGALYDPFNPFSGHTVQEIEAFNSYFESNIYLAEDGLEALGYDVTLAYAYPQSSLTTLSTYISSFMSISNAYGFYFTGHGTTTNIGNYYTPVLDYQDVYGNWHFVYLDACYTAANTNWANAFHVYGYSNRAFLGWSSFVSAAYSFAFNYEFWPYMNGYNPVQSSAVAAAADVPGVGTTPIRFYGDTSYTGTAWS